MTTTSFAGLSSNIERIEIPIIQRDYAQGRMDETTRRIRSAFLDALLKALEPNAKAQPLDFVYGEIKKGALIPLDGQQRLTTLFLLHWYLAARLGIATDSANWSRLPTFTYRTRASSTAFCQQLATCRPPFANPLADEKDPTKELGDWFKDQSWFPRAWERDPTIIGMLVTLDDLNERLRAWSDGKLQSAWDRLTNAQSPAIHFDFLSIANIGPADRQYIRMNARGKPLTEFERFKARFEEILGHASPTDRTTFSHRVDGPWTDLLWPLRDSGKKSALDAVIDDEFLRLFCYLSALAVWKFKLLDCKAEPGTLELHMWAESIFGQADANGDRRAFLFKAMDALHNTFSGKDRPAIEATFAQWFSKEIHQQGKLALFETETNLLTKCVVHFGEPSIEKSRFSLAQTLLFYALLQGWMKGSAPDLQRLRVLRNLLLAPDAYLSQGKMADHLPGVEHLIDHGLPSAGTSMPGALKFAFSERQLTEEVEKLALKSASAALAADIERLEDHPLLRGCLFAFDLQANPADIRRRVDTFYELFPPGGLLRYGELLTGALLTKGDYSRPVGNNKFQFGSATQDPRWRDVLTGPRVDPLTIRTPLAALLDDVAAGTGDIPARLQDIVDNWRTKQKQFDWRYYLVNYKCMRSGESGLYYSYSGSMGFDLCMLHTDVLRSYYDDPYIVAIIEQSGIPKEKVIYWFGYSAHLQQDARWLQAKGGANILRHDPAGWVVNPPNDPAQHAAFIQVCSPYGMKQRNGEWILEVPPRLAAGGLDYDTADRIDLGRKLLVDLLPLYL
ncbi:MAG: DUF262 domain-containing protein [Azovibrio sp.]|uniref:DUF262 domain-containing protein n=1 Tax=Azovibrio sp. TaxID=1872673 RepID=UPI003C76C3EE